MMASGIPPFRPGTDGGAGARVVQRALAVGPIRRVAVDFGRYADPLLHRLTRGRFGVRMGMPFASMTTTGARSGQPRTAAVLYFTDGQDVILIASNWGRARHPAWYHNLKANPLASLARGERSGTYCANEVTDEAERERLFGLADSVYPGYADYRARAANIGRRIPLMRLSPADQEGLTKG
jgi:deazaflavin-dependent oxidoreductase (nitroreductase family)